MSRKTWVLRSYELLTFVYQTISQRVLSVWSEVNLLKGSTLDCVCFLHRRSSTANGTVTVQNKRVT